MFRATFRSRTRQQNETLPELDQAIKRITRQCYPSATQDLRETMGRDFFIDALGDAETRWKMLQARPKTLNNALTIAVELEAFVTAERQRGKKTRAVRTDTVNIKLTESLRGGFGTKDHAATRDDGIAVTETTSRTTAPGISSRQTNSVTNDRKGHPGHRQDRPDSRPRDDYSSSRLRETTACRVQGLELGRDINV
ncbi:hypothetical protein QZH41_003451 [Actinostola sp. cb2023]|nr:hypothetical protein QZH41_003451 [Actinostola sp. cb2023]